ncbi:MAG: dihydrodipicolinate synthase family protein [Gammaproteobacteria bacterium]|nr:dihydrodipicolinate synthase family protein [Gammaproteobacteria bacterium]
MSPQGAAAQLAANKDIETLPAYGVWTPVLMPVDESYAIDPARFLEHARLMLERGCHGLAVFGTTSEANSFSVNERKALVETAFEGGISPDRVMIGTGCCALSDSVELSRHAVSLGCKKVLVLPPFYYKNMSDAGLFRSYAALIERVGDPELKIFLYHFPQLSGVPITSGLIELLLEAFPGVVAGLKDSSGDWDNTAGLLEHFPGFAVFPGSETYMLKGLRSGGAGCITATANANPGAIRRVYDAWHEGDGASDSLNERIVAVRAAIAEYPLVPALKFLASRLYDDPAWRNVRPPMLPLSDANGADLMERLERAGFDGL